MPLRSVRTACLPLAAALFAAASGGAFAKDRPGTPTDVRVQADGPTTVTVSFTNTARQGERVVFELEQTVNGRRISPDAEKLLSSKFRASFTPGQISGRVTGLAAGSENCFRVWSRTKPTSRFILDNTGVRSEHASGWGYARVVRSAGCAFDTGAGVVAASVGPTPSSRCATTRQPGRVSVPHAVSHDQPRASTA